MHSVDFLYSLIFCNALLIKVLHSNLKRIIEKKEILFSATMLRPLNTLPIPSSAISSLQANGYHYLEDVITPMGMCSEARDLLKSNGELHKEDTWMALCKEAPITRTALDVWQVRVDSIQQLKQSEEASCSNIATFSKAIDGLLGGGVPPFVVTEFCGPPGSGKTQMCLQLSVNVQLPKKAGGLAGEVIFIDTSSSFFLSRARDIAEACESHCLTMRENQPELRDELVKVTTQNLLDGIHILSIHGHIKLLAAVCSLRALLKQHRRVRLIIVDSMSFPFLGTSDTDYLERICLLYRILNELQKLSNDYKLAVVITNQLTTRITSVDKDLVAELVPALGETFAHRINQRVLLGDVANNRTATLIKGRISPDNFTVPFVINKCGIRDYRLKRE